MDSIALIPMDAPMEFNDMPLLCSCSGAKDLKALVESSKEASKCSDLILLLGHSEKLIPRILPAFMNARIRMKDGIARSKRMQIEMMLLICGSMKIDKALKMCGAKDPKKFLIFATDEKSLSAFVKKNSIKVTKSLKMELDPRIAGKVAMTELLSE